MPGLVCCGRGDCCAGQGRLPPMEWPVQRPAVLAGFGARVKRDWHLAHQCLDVAADAQAEPCERGLVEFGQRRVCGIVVDREDLIDGEAEAVAE